MRYNCEGAVCTDKEGTGGQMTAIRGLAEIVLAVPDLDRALAFYEGVLGLERSSAGCSCAGDVDAKRVGTCSILCRDEVR
jgi:Glyoxalase/Bleomycin resistance protein/Dioxygenase superfamily